MSFLFLKNYIKLNIKMIKNKTLVIIKILFTIVLLSGYSSLFSQSDDTDEMKKLMNDVKTDKKLLIISNLGLTDEQYNIFITIYNDYQAELQTINDRLVNLINDYAKAYNNNTVTNEFAGKMLDEAISIDKKESDLKEVYSKQLLYSLPAIKVLKYLQMENKIRAAINYELARGIPLVK